jgi:integrase
VQEELAATAAVPVRERVVEAIRMMPPRIDTTVLFPAPRGGRIDLEKFRHREWAPALHAAGVSHRRVYDCRHTFASWAIAGGVSLFHLSKIMGTSTTMIGEVYGHLLPDSEDYLRGLLDTTTTPRRRQQEPHDELRRAHENVAPLQRRPSFDRRRAMA